MTKCSTCQLIFCECGDSDSYFTSNNYVDAICGGCGAYGIHGKIHNRRDPDTGELEECGEFV